jgi:hypothetical protein
VEEIFPVHRHSASPFSTAMRCSERGEPPPAQYRTGASRRRHCVVTAQRLEVRRSRQAGKYVSVREYEIGSEAWARDRIDRGLDPSEGDRPVDDRLLRVEIEPGFLLDRRDDEYSPGGGSLGLAQ